LQAEINLTNLSFILPFLWGDGKKGMESEARNCEIKFAVIAQPWKIG